MKLPDHYAFITPPWQPRLVGSLLFSLVPLFTWAQAPGSTAVPIVHDRPNRIIEVPSEVPSGKHNTFMLSSLPASPNDVHLFLKGVELIQGKNYLLEDKTITLLAPEATDPQSLKVLYQTQFPLTSTVPELSLQRQAVIDRAVLSLALRDKANGYPRDSDPNKPDEGQLSSPRSLALLVRTLKEADAPRTHNKKGAGKRRQSSAEGIDGLGDSLPTSNYSLLLGASDAGDPHHQIESRTTVGSQARSLVMLQRRINEAGSK